MLRSAREYYAILEVPYGADTATLKKAFRKLAKKYHPDTNSDNQSAENKFKDINEAYSFLSDPDNFIAAEPSPEPPPQRDAPREPRKQNPRPLRDEPDEFDFYPEGGAGNHQVQFWGMEFIIGLMIVVGLFVFLFPGPRSSTTEKNGSAVHVISR